MMWKHVLLCVRLATRLTVGPADLFVPLRNKSSSYSYYYSHTFSNPLSEATIKATELKFARNS